MILWFLKFPLFRISICEAHLLEKDEIIKGMKERHEIERKEIENENKMLARELEEWKINSKCENARLEDKLSDANDQIMQ